MTEISRPPRRRLDVRVRRLGETFHLARREQTYDLDEVASLVWRHLDGERSPADLAGVLVGEYGIDHDEALADVSALLASMEEQGLVER